MTTVDTLQMEILPKAEYDPVIKYNTFWKIKPVGSDFIHKQQLISSLNFSNGFV